jgi:hypothetical protein
MVASFEKNHSGFVLLVWKSEDSTKKKNKNKQKIQ